MAFRGSAISEVNPTCISFPSTADQVPQQYAQSTTVLYYTMSDIYCSQSVVFFFLYILCVTQLKPLLYYGFAVKS